MREEDITPEHRLAAVELAQRMAEVIGKQHPVVVVMACSILLKLVWISKDVDSYIDYAAKVKAKAAKEAGL